MEEKDTIMGEKSGGNEPQKIDVVNNSKSEEQLGESNMAEPYVNKPLAPQSVVSGKDFPGEVKEKDVFVDDKKKSKSHSLFKSVLVIIVVWVFFAAAGGAYIWRDNQAKNTEAEKDSQIASLQASLKETQDKLALANTTDIKTCTVKSPSASVTENIRASITSANTQALEGYMATSVTTVLAASEEGGTYTQTQAVSNITAFIADATSPWNFDISASVLGSYGEGDYAQYFPGSAIVGKSANNKVISFSFDCDAKIKTVLMSGSEDILK